MRDFLPTLANALSSEGIDGFNNNWARVYN